MYRLFVESDTGTTIKRREGGLAQGGARRIRLERFPGYAPDLNPDEGIWNYLKRVELGNVCCQNLAHLRRHLRLATARLRHKRSVIQGCARECGYAV